jgi:hypothetical protein
VPAARADEPIDVAGTLVRVQVRRHGGRAWIRRAVVTRAGVAGFGIGLLTLRGAADAPYAATDAPDREPAAGVVHAYDPGALLDRLARAHVAAFREVRSSAPDAHRTVWRAPLTPRQSRTLGLRIVTVTTDAHGTPVALSYMTTSGLRVAYRVTRSHSPLAVSAPPIGTVQVPDRPLPDATGPYAPLTTVAVGGRPVEIQRAEADDGWSCWRVRSTPAYVGAAAPRPSGGSCVAPVTGGTDPTDAFAIPLDAVAPTPYELVGFLAPAGSTGEVRLEDGTTRPLAPGGAGLLVFSGPAHPAALLVTVHLPAGATLVCGPGPISGPADLERIAPRDVDGLRSRPWNCLDAG